MGQRRGGNGARARALWGARTRAHAPCDRPSRDPVGGVPPRQTEVRIAGREGEGGEQAVAAVCMPERDLAPLHGVVVGGPPDRDRPGCAAILPVGGTVENF